MVNVGKKITAKNMFIFKSTKDLFRFVHVTSGHNALVVCIYYAQRHIQDLEGTLLQK